jgi:hypothetical protein
MMIAEGDVLIGRDEQRRVKALFESCHVCGNVDARYQQQTGIQGKWPAAPKPSAKAGSD